MKLYLCPICQSSNTVELYPANINPKKLSFTYTKTPDSNKTFRSVRCRNCTHVFCSPLPKNIYKNYEDVVDKEYLRYEISLVTSARLVLKLIKDYFPSGRILDVGCATGVFLEIAKKEGYSVEGLELSRWSSEIAKKKAITIYRERLDKLAKQKPGRYDIITLFGVIEHFEEPIKEMDAIKKLLKPGGLLVVWTGDVNSLPSQILGKKWWYWQGQHIQYFTNESLSYLGKLCGLKHRETKIYPFVATYELMGNYLGRYSKRSLLMQLLKPVFKLKPVWVLRLPGEMLWFATKNN